MSDPTQKFKDIIKESKSEIEKNTESVVQAANRGLSLIVGIFQLCLVYLSYYILSQKFELTFFTIWEFLGVGIGALSLLSFIRNYIKDIIGTTKKETE